MCSTLSALGSWLLFFLILLHILLFVFPFSVFWICLAQQPKGQRQPDRVVSSAAIFQVHLNYRNMLMTIFTFHDRWPSNCIFLWWKVLRLGRGSEWIGNNCIFSWPLWRAMSWRSWLQRLWLFIFLMLCGGHCRLLWFSLPLSLRHNETRTVDC